MKSGQTPVTVAPLLRRIITNPAVAAITMIATIISVPLTVYLFNLSREVPRLTFFVSPTTAIVVKAGQASHLKVLHDDREIAEDITAVQIAIWNAGSKSIRPESVLKRIKVETAGGAAILEASLRSTTRDVIGVDLDRKEMASGRLGLDWRILEHNDGFSIQALVAADADRAALLRVTGVIEGQTALNRHVPMRSTGREETALGKWLDTYWGSVIFAATGLGSLIFALVIRLRRRTMLFFKRDQSLLAIAKGPDVYIFVGIFGFGRFLIGLLWTGNVDPPFGV